mmetsp:Transcript_19538/g.44342  ORF Transcript_19538/g.44342 Transcript_19538/m.44342 type:complete len:174 (-) Transcript_19538:124-645(-)
MGGGGGGWGGGPGMEHAWQLATECHHRGSVIQVWDVREPFMPLAVLHPPAPGFFALNPGGGPGGGVAGAHAGDEDEDPGRRDSGGRPPVTPRGPGPRAPAQLPAQLPAHPFSSKPTRSSEEVATYSAFEWLDTPALAKLLRPTTANVPEKAKAKPDTRSVSTHPQTLLPLSFL